MFARLVAGVSLTAALVLAPGEGMALADDGPKAPVTTGAPAGAPSPAPTAAPAARAQPHGAVVVAASEGAGPAARALAFDVYRDPDLRPDIDDATARVLAGEPVPEAAASPAGAPQPGPAAHLKEIAELCGSIAHAGSDLVARRLLASLGTELGATLVVSVTMDGGRPVARALRPATAAFERIELGPTVDIGTDGGRAYRWPGGTATLRGLLPVAPVTMGGTPQPPAPAAAPPVVDPAVLTAPAPLAPKADTAAPLAPSEPRPFYKSPWFWGALGGAAALGLSVFFISKATTHTTDVHLMGKVGP